MEDVRGLPCSREEERLALSKLGAFSKPAMLEPMRHDAWVLAKGRQGVSKNNMTHLLLCYLGNKLYNFLH
jgi:hypothetical protein